MITLHNITYKLCSLLHMRIHISTQIDNIRTGGSRCLPINDTTVYISNLVNFILSTYFVNWMEIKSHWERERERVLAFLHHHCVYLTGPSWVTRHADPHWHLVPMFKLLRSVLIGKIFFLQYSTINSVVITGQKKIRVHSYQPF